MAKLSLIPIGSAYGSIGALNSNFDAVEAAIENTLSRDGTGPNAMLADLDMNSKNILNAGDVYVNSLVVNGVQVSTTTSFLAAGYTALPLKIATAGQTAFTTSPTSLAPSSLVMVFVNGLKLPQSAVTFNSTTVTIPAMSVDDEVEIVEIKVA